MCTLAVVMYFYMVLYSHVFVHMRIRTECPIKGFAEANIKTIQIK